MTKIKKHPRRLRSRHRAAKTNHKVRALLAVLKKRWEVLRPVERMKRLEHLVALGCSRRGLAHELRISPTNVRFYLGLKGVSAQQLSEVARGVSVKKTLQDAEIARVAANRKQQILVERETSLVSTQLAKEIADFCMTTFQFGNSTYQLSAGHFEKLFYAGMLDEEIRRRLAFSVYLPSPASPGTAFWITAQRCRPNPSDYAFWFAYVLDWLAFSVISAAPEALIRDAAIKKTERLLQAASLDLALSHVRQRVSS